MTTIEHEVNRVNKAMRYPLRYYKCKYKGEDMIAIKRQEGYAPIAIPLEHHSGGTICKPHHDFDEFIDMNKIIYYFVVSIGDLRHLTDIKPYTQTKSLLDLF